jgi:hypothetical protein
MRIVIAAVASRFVDATEMISGEVRPPLGVTARMWPVSLTALTA